MKQNNKKAKIMSVILAAAMAVCNLPVSAFAESAKTDVMGKVYKFDEDSHYEFSENKDFINSEEADTYGKFSVGGNITDISSKNGVPSYEIGSGDIEIFYTYGDTLLKADEEEKHLIEDKSKKLDDMKLEDKIKKGVILVQISKDLKNWSNLKVITNAFEEVPVRTDSLYKSNEVELISGSYYRVIVAYETGTLKGQKKVTFVKFDDYEYEKNAEIYMFYAYKKSEDKDRSLNQRHNLGEKVRVENFKGYSGSEEIDRKDAHYGWELGHFFVDGYTDKVKNSDGEMVFLKNVGDKVTLWFNLKQDINKLNGDKDKRISADEDGYDQYFETPRMNFGKGTLIIRHTDYNGNKSEPQIYTDYLAANIQTGADTKVKLFEEGDYEVALDYEVTDDKLIDKVGHYRIFFKFSVRNGNCMVYPFDITTGSELTNSSIVDYGFKIDLAKSRYLKVNVKKEKLSDGADGLVEDIRFNGPAKDGEEYTQEGVYTITVTNEYTNQTTTKKIYVGKNDIMKAYMTTGLSIPEIKNLVAEGATIDDDGTITLKAMNNTENEELVEPDNQTEEKIEVDTNSQIDKEPEQSEDKEVNQSADKETETKSGIPIIPILVVGVVVIVILFAVSKKKSSGEK